MNRLIAKDMLFDWMRSLFFVALSVYLNGLLCVSFVAHSQPVMEDIQLLPDVNFLVSGLTVKGNQWREFLHSEGGRGTVGRLLYTPAFVVYKVLLSPQLGKRCLYEPSCSAFFLRVSELRGGLLAFLLIGDRLMRCNLVAVMDAINPNPYLGESLRHTVQ